MFGTLTPAGVTAGELGIIPRVVAVLPTPAPAEIKGVACIPGVKVLPGTREVLTGANTGGWLTPENIGTLAIADGVGMPPAELPIMLPAMQNGVPDTPGSEVGRVAGGRRDTDGADAAAPVAVAAGGPAGGGVVVAGRRAAWIVCPSESAKPRIEASIAV